MTSLVAFSLALAGCGAQADTAYRGTPLAELHGSVQTSAALPSPPPLDAAMEWSGNRPGADAKASVSRPWIGTSVPVSGRFPAQFALQLFTPPPQESMFSCFQGEPARVGSLATGRVTAVLHGASATPRSITDSYGDVKDFIVLYVDADLPAVSDCPVGALAKGYHLFHFTPTPDKPGCVRQAPDDPRCNGPWPFTEVPMTTELTLTLQHEDGTATPPAPPINAAPPAP